MIPTQTQKNQQGFTLIELSIVLVIIGLIVGGVLVGQDLIKTAEVRAAIAQIEKYNSAVNTFRGKYNGVPGDLEQAQATAFGLYSATAATGAPAFYGDGNGLLEGGAASGAAPAGTNIIGENAIFWRHLSEANIVDGAFGTIGTGALTAASGAYAVAVTTPSQAIPTSKLGPAGSITVYGNSGLNYYQIVPITQIATTGAPTLGTNGMTPIQAYNIDAKIDDGAPNAGTVLARSIATGATLNTATTYQGSGTASTTACAVGAAATLDQTATYNRNTTSTWGGNLPICSLRLRFN